MIWILLAIIGYLIYWCIKQRQIIKRLNTLLEIALVAGVTSAGANKYLDDFTTWTESVPVGEIDEVIFSLYDRYHLPRPEYAIINTALRDHLKRDFRTGEAELNKRKDRIKRDIDY